MTTVVTPWPQPRSHQVKPPDRVGGATPERVATKSSQAGVTLTEKAAGVGNVGDIALDSRNHLVACPVYGTYD